MMFPKNFQNTLRLLFVWSFLFTCHSVCAQVFQKITSTSQLETKKEYIIVCESASGVMTSESNGSHKLKNENITIANNIVALPSGSKAAIFTLGGSSNNYTFNTTNGYLANSSDDNLDLEKANTNGKWRVSFNEEDVRLQKSSAAKHIQKSNNGDYYGYYTIGSEVQLYKKLDDATSVTITNAQYATFCSGDAYDFSKTGVTAYTATCSDGIVSLHKIANGIVPGNTGVVLYKETDQSQTIGVPQTSSDAGELPANDLLVSDGSIISDGATYYALAKKESGVGFYLVANGVTIPQNKPYLLVSEASTREYLPFNGTEETGISLATDSKDNNLYFDLQGRQVIHPEKGIFISKGRKFILR